MLWRRVPMQGTSEIKFHVVGCFSHCEKVEGMFVKATTALSTSKESKKIG
jgi:hypothetical protein